MRNGYNKSVEKNSQYNRETFEYCANILCWVYLYQEQYTINNHQKPKEPNSTTPHIFSILLAWCHMRRDTKRHIQKEPKCTRPKVLKRNYS